MHSCVKSQARVEINFVRSWKLEVGSWKFCTWTVESSAFRLGTRSLRVMQSSSASDKTFFLLIDRDSDKTFFLDIVFDLEMMFFLV